MTAVRREAVPVPGPAMVMRRGRLVRSNVASADQAMEIESASIVDYPPLKLPTATMIVLMVVSIFIPISYSLGTMRMTPYLALLVVAFLPMLVIWAMGRRTKIILPDVLILLFCLWAALAIVLSQGFVDTLQTVGVHTLQTFGAYLAGRLLVRDPASMRLLVRTVVIAILIMIPFVVIESIIGTQPLFRIFAAIGTPLADVDTGIRMGLHRSQGAFEHPILMGVFCASILSMGFYSFRDARYKVMRWIAAPVVGFCGLMSMSTGALLSINIQFGLMAWGRIFRTVVKRWRILTALLIAAYVFVDLMSTRTPFHVFVNYATFSAQSSYNRILIWQYGTEEVARHPFFGVGLGEWQRPSYMSSSMDNFWLVQAVRYGLPAFLLLAASFIIILRRAGRLEAPSKEIEQLRRGALFSIIATMVAIVSVHLWNASYVWLMFLLGSITWLAVPPKTSGEVDPRPDRNRPPAPQARPRNRLSPVK